MKKKKESLVGTSEKWREKMASTSRNISCPFAGIIYPGKFKKKIAFRQVSTMLSTDRKKALESVLSQNNVTF